MGPSFKLNEMKKYILVFLLLVVAIACNNKNKTKNKHERYVKTYENALRLGDINVAINACYEILANDSTLINYYDTLVYLYLNTRNQGSTYLTARESLKYKPDNPKMTRIAADYARDLGMPDTAIMFYRKTFSLTNDLENLYDVAQAQYNQGNYAGAEETADLIIKNPNSEKQKISISLDKVEAQSVPLKAAALNVKGTIFIELGNKEIALRYIEEALALAPDFSVARKNKEDILTGKIKFKK